MQGAMKTWQVLDAFSLDDLPMFSRTVLTSSPVLVLPGRETPGPVSFRESFMSSTNPASPPPPLVRNSSSVVSSEGRGTADDLPVHLQHFIRLHKRAASQLFQLWEEQGKSVVSVDDFARGVKTISGEKLSDDDLLTLLHIVDPMRGDEVHMGEQWRARMLDCKRLWRMLVKSASKASSQYIRKSSSRTGDASPENNLRKTGLVVEPVDHRPSSWSSMLQEKGANPNPGAGLIRFPQTIAGLPTASNDVDAALGRARA